MPGAFDKFNKSSIGFGKNYRSGKGYFNRVGLDGAFRRLKDPSYGSVAKNLSAQDIDNFRELIEKKLKSKYTYSEGLNWRDREELRFILEKWVRAGKITQSDQDDFEKIIDQLSAK